MKELALATLGLLFLIKIVSLIRNVRLGLPRPQGVGWILYLFLWPGVRPESFSRRGPTDEAVGAQFVESFVFFFAGILLQTALFLSWDPAPGDLRLYLGLISILITVHLGLAGLLMSTYRILGWPVEPLFLSPLKSDSLRDFWSRRWNLAFVDMNKRLFRPVIRNSMGIFLLSGVLHEIGISFPAHGGWGGPLLYFLLQGLLINIEPARFKRLWVWTVLLLPLPLLFPLPFLTSFVQPYFDFGHLLMVQIVFRSFLQWLIFACGFGHLLILVASFQVPARLGWKAEFARLGRFNQKIFWTYGGYIVFCIVAFGLADLFVGNGLLERNSSSLAIAVFIALFWTVRVVVDFGYFKHEDWPTGDLFVIGHTCLTALFCGLALTHWGVVGWQLLA